MSEVRRWDIGHIDAVDKLPNGFLRVKARIARIGIQMYADGRGGIRREYRAPEEVFDGDAIGSFKLMPLTLDHPREDGKSVAVTAQNVSKYRIGTLGEDVSHDDKYVTATIQIEDAKAIDAIERLGWRELSSGYNAETILTPGTAPDGQKYDAVQRRIRGNHVAIVPMGRAGSAVRLIMDATDAVQVEDPAPPSKGENVKLKIDGYEFEVEDRAAQAIEKERKQYQDAITAEFKAKEAAQKIASEAQAKADAAEEKVKALESKADPKFISAAVASRVALEKSASKVAPKVKVDGLDDKSVKVAVLKELGIKVDGKDEHYIAARFDVAVEDAEKKNPAAAARVPTEPGSKTDADEETLKTDATAAHAALKDRSKKAHTGKIPGAVSAVE